MTEQHRDDLTNENPLAQQPARDFEGEDPVEAPEPGRDSNTAKDTKIVRGDNRPQTVRHGG